MRLSQARAVAVEKFLEANGVSPAQLTAKGYGPDKPVASNKTVAGRAQNRRVELVRLN
jgi:OOP family OmpA-OmpF porin